MRIKRTVVVFITLIFAMSLASCSMFGSTTEKYLKALKNTQNAKTMQSKTEQKIKVDYSKASDKVKSFFKDNKLDEITINVDDSMDNRNNKAEESLFFSAGEIIASIKMYVDGDNVYLNAPVAGSEDKYFRLSPQDGGLFTEEGNEYFDSYDKFYKEMYEVWKNSVEGEILSSEGTSIQTTPDGDIKVTQLSLSLTDEKVKDILMKLAGLISQNEEMKKAYINMSKEFIPETEDRDKAEKSIKEFLDNLPGKIEGINDKFVLEKLKLTAKIDKDYYIIDEILEADLVIKHEGELKISFYTHITRWNIDRDINVNIPEIHEDQIMQSKDIDKEISGDFKKMFQDIFLSKD